MKKMFLMGRSEAGKTSLVQALKGETLHYEKTQYVNSEETVIDSPGEYSETKNCGHALACFSFEADVIALLMAADEPYTLFNPACQSFFNRPIIGVITKIPPNDANDNSHAKSSKFVGAYISVAAAANASNLHG